MSKGEFPSHFLYGACHLGDHGIDVVWHRSPRKDRSRIATALYTAWRILTCREHFDAIYATHYKGLELIVLLRAIGLYRRPIVVWHHQPVVKSASRLRELCGRLFYRGLDRMIFFSKKLYDDSLLSRKARPAHMVVGHWGADLDFYDSIAVSPSNNTFTFIATGKEQRDQPTLIEAFNRTRRHLRLFIGINPDPNVPNPNLDAVRRCKPADNIEVKEICGLLPYEIAIDVAHADWIVDHGLMDYDNMINIDGWYEGEDGEYHYILYLRPWGVLWDDVAANGEDMSLPYYYDIYKSYIEAGLPLPENVRELAGETD